jgi:BlaI family penicillinase repressor
MPGRHGVQRNDDEMRNSQTGRRKQQTPAPYYELSPCERRAMEVVYQLGQASARDVWRRLPGQPHYSSVRTVLTKLENKGYLFHEENQLRYCYRPTVRREEARAQVLRHIVGVFFAGSIDEAIAALCSTTANAEMWGRTRIEK